MPTTTGAAHAAEAPLQPITLGWALKRAVLGIVILAVAMGGVAWLTYASIDPELERGEVPKAVKATHTIPEQPLHL
jgi:hypothetical protein